MIEMIDTSADGWTWFWVCTGLTVVALVLVFAPMPGWVDDDLGDIATIALGVVGVVLWFVFMILNADGHFNRVQATGVVESVTGDKIGIEGVAKYLDMDSDELNVEAGDTVTAECKISEGNYFCQDIEIVVGN